MPIKTIKLKISGMTCDHCAKTIEQKLDNPGIIARAISYPEHSGIVTFDAEKLSAEDIVQFINQTGHYRAQDFEELSDQKSSSAKHLIIIGGGSAAFSAALQGHESGARVTMINAGLPIGGTCVNVGCVPSKILLRAAHDMHQAQKTVYSGIQKTAQLTSFKDLIKEKKDMVQALQEQKYIDVIKDLPDFELIEGRAKILSSNRVEVNGRIIYGDALIVATGAAPSLPAIPGLEDVPFLTNETLYDLEELPKHLIILGANYIGLEAAQMFARFGSKVTVLELQRQILPGEGPDIARELQKHLQADGIEFLTDTQTTFIENGDQGIRLNIKHSGTVDQLTGSHLLIATGRRGNTDQLFAPELKVELLKGGFLKTNDYLETNLPGVFAAGDVIGRYMFVYTAALEGKMAAINALSPNRQKIDYQLVPWVIFTDPQVAGIGLDESQAIEAGYQAESAILPVKHIPRFIVSKEERGFIKLIRDAKSDRLLGARIVAPEGSELLMEIAMGMKFGITIAQLREMLHPYLTATEGVKLAAITFSKSVEKLSCCAT